MKKALKELIDNAPRRDCGEYAYFLLIPTNKMYNGLWGKNNYNNIIVLGYDKVEKKHYRLDSVCGSDDFGVSQIYSAHIDIPREYGCLRMHFSEPVSVRYPASSVLAYGKGR